MKRRDLIIATILLFSTVLVLHSSIVKADIKVYDNNNQYLGLLLGLTNNNVSIFLPSVGASWEYDYYTNTPCPNVPAPVCFDSSDCTGTPYATFPLPWLFDLSIARGGFYIPDYSGRRTFVPNSIFNSHCECESSAGIYREYYPLVQVQMPFTTPIALPLRFEVSTGAEASTKTVVIPMF